MDFVLVISFATNLGILRTAKERKERKGKSRMIFRKKERKKGMKRVG